MVHNCLKLFECNQSLCSILLPPAFLYTERAVQKVTMPDEVLALDYIQIWDFTHESPLQVTSPLSGSPQNPIVVSDLDLAPLGSIVNPIPIDLEPAHSPGTLQNPIVIDDDDDDDDDDDIAAFKFAADLIPTDLDNVDCSHYYLAENADDGRDPLHMAGTFSMSLRFSTGS